MINIKCNTMVDFLTNTDLLLEDGPLYRGSIFVDVETESEDEFHTSVTVNLSAYSTSKTEMVQATEYCGKDILTADGGSFGTDKAMVLITELEAFCEAHLLVLNPGQLQIT